MSRLFPCKEFIESKNGLVYCSHKENPDDHEGNCQRIVCPKGAEHFNLCTKVEKALDYVIGAPYVYDSKWIKKREQIIKDLCE